MKDVMSFILCAALVYLFGSIPFGLIIGKILKGIDIRESGSGNIGAANAFRALGPVGGTLVLLFDIGKGLLPVLLAPLCIKLFAVQGEALPLIKVVAGFAAIMGHNYSMFLKFKGGKGIATSLGVIFALDWKIALICFTIWLLMVLTTRYSSLGSLSGSLMLPILMIVFKDPAPYIVFSTLACISAFYSHRGNIKKLIQGKELKITEKHSGAGTGAPVPAEPQSTVPVE